MNNNVSENPRAQHPATPKCVGEAISGTTAKELCAIDSGFAFDSEQFNADGDGMPIIRIRDIKPGVTNTYTTEAFDSRYLVNDGDMLIGMDGEFNLVKWHSGSALLNQRVCRIQSKSTLLLDDYLRHFLPVALKQIEMRTACVTVKHLSIKALNAIEIPLVSMERQRAIAFQLDNIDEQLGIARKQLSMLDSLVKSRFVEMFGDPAQNNFHWRMAPLGENAKLINGRAYKQNELLASGKYPVLRVGNFFSNRDWYYSDLELDEKKYCNNGDLLYAWSASFGPKIWDGGKVIYHYHIWKVEVGDAYNKYFLCKLLKYAEKSFLGDTHGIGMLHLTKAGMEEAPFIVPPLDLQDRFVVFVSQVNKSRFVDPYCKASELLLK